MSKAKTAKTAEKKVEKASEIFFKGKKVKPVLYINGGRSYMAVAYVDGVAPNDMAYAPDGFPIPWSNLQPDKVG
jgi:hypothetical protein